MIKNLPDNARETRNMASVPGLGRYPGGANGNPLQYSCLENHMDRGAQHSSVHGVAKNQTRLKRLSTHAHYYTNVITDFRF